MTPSTRHALDIDTRAEAGRIELFLVEAIRKKLHRNGAVVGVSGGIDSSVVLALCVRSLGPERTKAIIMPEADSDPASERIARNLAAQYGVEAVVEDISGALHGFGCYHRRDEAIRAIFPEYDAASGYKAKITVPPNLLDSDVITAFSLQIVAPDGKVSTQLLHPREFCQIVAATSFKQRTRMSMLYYHAELNNFAVVGTANKNEHDLGFFVKHGDAGVDVAPIEHLFKTQVYQLAEYLGIPEEIRRRPPTSDTYSAPSTQQEFFFRLPFETLDRLWHALEQGASVQDTAREMNLTERQVERAYQEIARKRRTTEHLRTQPLTLSQAAAHEVAAKAKAHGE